MLLLHMRPEQIRAAVAQNTPVILAAGVMEYHGPHLPAGTDFLIAESVVTRVEQRCECIVAPPLCLGPTMSWAAGPEDGEIDFDPEIFAAYAKAALGHLMDMGFRRIYVLQHHQGIDGLQALILRTAASALVRERALQWGAGWGRGEHEKLPNPDLFTWIRVGVIDSFAAYPDASTPRCPIGHGGKGETQLIMAGYPETVRMDALEELSFPTPEWLRDSHCADEDEGAFWLDFCADGWARELST